LGALAKGRRLKTRNWLFSVKTSPINPKWQTRTSLVPKFEQNKQRSIKNFTLKDTKKHPFLSSKLILD